MAENSWKKTLYFFRCRHTKGNNLLEICTPDITISWISDRGTINGYQEKIDRISTEYLTDFSSIIKKYLLDIPKN